MNDDVSKLELWEYYDNLTYARVSTTQA